MSDMLQPVGREVVIVPDKGQVTWRELKRLLQIPTSHSK